LKTRQGKCTNSEKCPLSRDEEIFTIEEGSPFECPLCCFGLVEIVPETPEAEAPGAVSDETQSVGTEDADQDVSPPQESVELPLPAETEAKAQDELPAEADWEAPGMSPTGREGQNEGRWEEAEAPGKRGEEARNEGLQTVQPIDREWWDADTTEVEDAPEVTPVPAPRGTEKAPPVILFVAVLVVLLIAAGFYAVTHKLIVLPGLALDSKGSQTTILKLSGSNLMGEYLMPAMAEAFLKYRGATGVHTVAGEHPGEKLVLGTLPGDVTASAIMISSRGTAGAFTSLADKACDIGMAARRIDADEASRLSTVSGDMYSPAQEHVVGLGGIAVIVNAANPMSTLSEDQVRQFFTGETTNMATATSPIGPVAVYARDEQSSTWEIFSAQVLGGRPLTASAKRIDTESALSDAVTGDPFGIGFVEFPFIRSAKPISVSDKVAIPLLPTRLTIATEDYPLAIRLYLYTPGNSSNPYARQFTNFALSQAGQEVVRAAGFVGQNVEPMPAPVPEFAPEEYRQLTAGARRMSVDFRFLPNSTLLDGKALADLDRVVAAILELRMTGEQVMLFGFSDSAGDRNSDQMLSLELARAVQSQLTAKGLPPSVVNGYGSALPVAASDTAEGRRRNRRVEVWVKE
jgi:phosphate transport system substrate-binding protein